MPLELMSVSNAEKLLQKVGRVMEIENPIVNGNLLRAFIRGRVTVDIERPLPTGCWAPRSSLQNLWIVYRYERLQSICYKCGILGHDQNSCSKPTVMSPFDPTKPKFSPELTISAPRSIHFVRNTNRTTETQSSTNYPHPKPTSNSEISNSTNTAQINPKTNEEEAYNKHYLAFKYPHTPPPKPNNPPSNLPNISLTQTTWETQNKTSTPLFKGSIHTIHLVSPNQEGN